MAELNLFIFMALKCHPHTKGLAQIIHVPKLGRHMLQAWKKAGNRKCSNPPTPTDNHPQSWVLSLLRVYNDIYFSVNSKNVANRCPQ